VSGALEDTIGALLAEHLRPLRAELQGLTCEVANLRKALPPQVGTLRDVARIEGVSYATAKRQATRGELPRLPGGGRPRYDLSALRPMTSDELTRETRRLRSAL
jgi:hypothetical protein